MMALPPVPYELEIAELRARLETARLREETARQVVERLQRENDRLRRIARDLEREFYL